MPEANQAALDFLLTRRSRPAKTLTAPAPTRTELMPLLTAAARTPDHGKLEPWRFIVLERGGLERVAAMVPARGKALGIDPDKAEKNRTMFADAPLMVAVISSPVENEKVPRIEQVYSAGAVCLSLLNAALASGWGANWVSGAKALAQLPDRRFRHVLLMGLGLTIALLAGATVLFGWLVGFFVPDSVTLWGLGEVNWLDSLASWATVLLMIVLSVVLMVPVAAAFTGIFLDEVAEAVEDKHYPGLAPVGHIPLFWAVNGLLLGREFFQMAAVRREGLEGARHLRKRHAGQIWLAGTVMAIPLSVPLVNLLMPILGAATFTHMYHRLAGR